MTEDSKDKLIAQLHELIKAQQKHISDLRTVLRNEDKHNPTKTKKSLDPSGGKC